MSKLVLSGTCIQVLIALVLPLSSQVQNGEFTGLITDPSGAVVNQARVLIHNFGTGYTLEARSNEVGIYAAKELTVGSYKLTVEAAGFKTVTASDVELNAGTVVRVDFKLQIGERQEAIEVTDAAVPINSENARLVQTVDSTQIANLPLNGRNVYDLIQYSPGATNMRGTIFENGANTVVNGVRESFNGFVINGVSNKGLSGGPVNQPIQDTVQEFQLLTLNNSAEFGNSAGAITNLVTKSGTNSLHGNVWEYFRNDALDANPFFANHNPDPAQRQKTPLHLNQFGGTLGGPIRKNKLFLFAAYQGDRFIISNPGEVLAESSDFRHAVITTFPNSISSLLYSNFTPSNPGSPAFTLRDYVNGGQFSGSGFANFGDYLCPNGDLGMTSAISNKFAALFGVEQADIDYMNQTQNQQPNCPGGSPYSTPVAGAFGRDLPFLVNVLNVGKSQVSENLFNGNEASLRLDYNFSAKDRIFGQFNWYKVADQFAGGNATQLRGFYNPSTTTTPNFQFSYIHTFTPTVLNEFRAGYAGNDFSQEAALPGVPGIGFDDLTVGFGSYSGYPLIFHENIYNYVDLVSLSHGKQSLKGGAEIRRNIENSNTNVGRPSYYFFDQLFFAIDQPYVESFAGVDPGFVSGQPAQLATSARHWRNWEYGFFFQDDWRVSRHLTLNLGLRYDQYTRHTELNNLATTFLKGPGQHLIDDIATGAGQIKSANVPCPGDQRGILAGECGPGGFAPSTTLGKGDHNDFGPHIGFAWDVLGDGKTSLRGGFGVSYEGTLYNPLSNTRWNPPYYSRDEATNALGGGTSNIVYGPVDGGTPTFLGPSPPGQHAGVGVQATGNISGWDPSNPHLAQLTSIVFPEGIRDPYVENWFLGVQGEIRPRLTLEVNYVGTAGHKLLRAESVNRVPGGALPEGVCVNDTFGRRLCSQISDNNPMGMLNPNYGNLRVWENIANSSYNGLQVSLKQQMSHGLQFGGNYTWSHSIDSGSSWHHSQASANGFGGGDGYTTDQTLPQLDRGNSTYDIRHRLTFNFVWEMPFLRERHDFVSVVLGGWQLNGIFSRQTGAHWFPYRGGQLASSNLQPDDGFADACDPATFAPAHCLNVGSDYNLDGVANDRPNAIANHVNATHEQWADGFNLPDNFFSPPCLGCVGNLGRNTFVGPGYLNLDTSLFKNFRLSDRFRLQFRAEAFNILNHTNFQLGVGNVGPSDNNRLQSPNFGKAGGTFSPRNLQFGLKLRF